MKLLKIFIVLTGSLFGIFILLDLPEMGELLTAIRLFLLFAVIGICWSVGGIVFERLFHSREE